MVCKRLLILGGSRYYLRSVRSAQELGYEVIVIDRNPTAPALSAGNFSEVVDITDFDGALDVARRYQISGILALNDFGVPTAAHVANSLGLPGISPEVARNVTNKLRMREVWRKHGAPSVPFGAAATLEEARVVFETLGTTPLILKPAGSRGGGSRGVSRIDRIEELEEALEFAQSFYEDKTVIIEEFVTGIEHSVETITVEGETHIVAVSDKEKTPPPYRVDKSVIYPSRMSGVDLEAIHAACLIAVRSLGITIGAAHVELCSTSRGPVLFELGARCGGGGTPDPIIPYHCGVELLKEVARLAVGEPCQQVRPKFTRGCVYRFLTPSPGMPSKIAGVEDIRALPGILDVDWTLPVGSRIPEVRTGADRSGFLIAGAEDRVSAIQLADRAEAMLAIDYGSRDS